MVRVRLLCPDAISQSGAAVPLPALLRSFDAAIQLLKNCFLFGGEFR
jgi:hypothetical protein